jgi:hypothetical protein
MHRTRLSELLLKLAAAAGFAVVRICPPVAVRLYNRVLVLFALAVNAVRRIHGKPEVPGHAGLMVVFL